ncbi:RecB family exonuclease [Candidatus Endomicrobiellum devescovinae]|jgi:RecB family exonuclease|uniref:RecB family exonuclease n=1 Tax=Candidatus Endomicrobiellum devescovinae TaxID=3242322 RepID=UPI00282968BA|nr:PD-(D/E)XK nuclease family protein [Endomicrobium sp.]
MIRQEFKISYSRVNTYLFCPYKYKLVYLDNFHIPVNSDITFGHIIHKTLEQFHGGGDQSRDALFECYDNAWKNDGFKDPQQIFEYYRRGNQMLENYYTSFCDAKPEVLYVEKPFDTNIGKYKFVGIIDRIDKHPDGTYEVMDYKTHVQIWEQERVDKDLQLTFYAYACKNILGFNPDKISVYFLSENKKVYTKRTQDDINNAINTAIDIAEKITAENFDPDLSKCFVCDFRFKCKHSQYRQGESKAV